jgi:hypothetical protein
MAGHSISHQDGSRTFIDYHDASGFCVVNGRFWRWYFHEFGGPTFLRADGQPRKNQFPTSKAVWEGFEKWHKRYERSKRKANGSESLHS